MAIYGKYIAETLFITSKRRNDEYEKFKQKINKGEYVFSFAIENNNYLTHAQKEELLKMIKKDNKSNNKSNKSYSKSQRITILNKAVTKANQITKTINIDDVGIGIYSLSSIKGEDKFSKQFEKEHGTNSSKEDYEDFINGNLDYIHIGSWNIVDNEKSISDNEFWNLVNQISNKLESIKDEEYIIYGDGANSKEGYFTLELK